MISIALIIALLYYVGINDVIGTILTVDPVILVMILPIFTLSLFFGSLSMKILYDNVKKIEFCSIFKWYSISWAVGGLLPGKFGDFSLAIFLKDKIKLSHSISIIFLSKFVSLILSSVFAFIMFFLFLDYYSSFYLTGLLAAIIAGVVIFFSNLKLRLFIRKKIMRSYESKFEGFSETFNNYFRHHKTRIIANTLVTFMKLLISVIIVYLLIYGFGYSADFFLILLIVFTTNIISMIPITINGLGLREGSFVYLASLIGLPISISASVILISASINYIFIFVIFLMFQKDVLGIKIHI